MLWFSIYNLCCEAEIMRGNKAKSEEIHDFDGSHSMWHHSGACGIFADIKLGSSCDRSFLFWGGCIRRKSCFRLAFASRNADRHLRIL